MTQTFTPEMLVQHLYHEMSADQQREIELALQEDYLLREEYEQLRAALRELPKVKFEPSAKTLALIQAESRLS